MYKNYCVVLLDIKHNITMTTKSICCILKVYNNMPNNYHYSIKKIFGAYVKIK